MPAQQLHNIFRRSTTTTTMRQQHVRTFPNNAYALSSALRVIHCYYHQRTKIGAQFATTSNDQSAHSTECTRLGFYDTLPLLLLLVYSAVIRHAAATLLSAALLSNRDPTTSPHRPPSWRSSFAVGFAQSAFRARIAQDRRRRRRAIISSASLLPNAKIKNVGRRFRPI